LAVGDDPLLRWFTNNTKLEPAPNNNFKYGKIEPKSRKTDGFMAFVAAMCVEEELPEPASMEFFTPIVF
jgi:phage terminase large subunit-like protein